MTKTVVLLLLWWSNISLWKGQAAVVAAFAPSGAAPNRSSILPPARRSRFSKLGSSSSSSSSQSNTVTTASEDDNPKDGKNEFSVESDIVLGPDIDISTAYELFADLPRQPDWSPWLKSVTYIADNAIHDNNWRKAAASPTVTTTTLWKMRHLGISMQWVAVSDAERNIYPTVTTWRTVRGLKNHGRVDFTETADGVRMKLRLTFVLPRPILIFLTRVTIVPIPWTVRTGMLDVTLRNFRAILQKQQEEKHGVTTAVTTATTTTATSTSTSEDEDPVPSLQKTRKRDIIKQRLRRILNKDT